MAWLLIGMVALVIGGAWWIMARDEQRHFDAQLQNLQRRIARQERLDQKRAKRQKNLPQEKAPAAGDQHDAHD